SIQSFKSTGTHTLIKQGAKLVEHAQDIMEEFSFIIEAPAEAENTADETPAKIPQLSLEESKVFEALGPYPVHIDDLARKLSMESGRLSSVLLQLELKNIVKQSPGKFFSIEERR
ncbi:MAG: DNA-protecting protein DprA, partial [Deltaproteobacteria bacterium]|nr:DNA-protecting protein DprA [Deltaproteobacteria bacterium]